MANYFNSKGNITQEGTDFYATPHPSSLLSICLSSEISALFDSDDSAEKLLNLHVCFLSLTTKSLNLKDLQMTL